MKMKCLIVDDDPLACKALLRFCQQVPELEVVHVATDGSEALQWLEKEDIDLLFLDVEMPGLSGIELLEALPALPVVIFTTAKKDYAYEAFEYKAVDYLKKPIAWPRFLEAVSKARMQLQNAVPRSAEEVYIKEDGRFLRLNYDDILYFENVGDYVRIKTTKGSHIIYSTLKNIYKKLDQTKFYRVHRTYIVNMSKIEDIEDNSLVVGGKVIPISRANKPTLMARIHLL